MSRAQFQPIPSPKDMHHTTYYDFPLSFEGESPFFSNSSGENERDWIICSVCQVQSDRSAEYCENCGFDFTPVSGGYVTDSSNTKISSSPRFNKFPLSLFTRGHILNISSPVFWIFLAPFTLGISYSVYLLLSFYDTLDHIKKSPYLSPSSRKDDNFLRMLSLLTFLPLLGIFFMIPLQMQIEKLRYAHFFDIHKRIYGRQSFPNQLTLSLFSVVVLNLSIFFAVISIFNISIANLPFFSINYSFLLFLFFSIIFITIAGFLEIWHYEVFSEHLPRH